jgi:hypothetical protein
MRNWICTAVTAFLGLVLAVRLFVPLQANPSNDNAFVWMVACGVVLVQLIQVGLTLAERPRGSASAAR